MLSFNNKPNKFHRDKNGNPFWESRSAAVEVSVFAIYKKVVYVLIEKRSDTMMDSPGLYALPSGYMDYDESGWEAAMREVYEETSLDISKYNEILVTDNNKQPFEIITDPKHNRQNIVLEYCVVLNFDKKIKRGKHKYYFTFPIEIEEYCNKEISLINWLPIEFISRKNFVWAFNHDERIKNAYKVFKNYIKPSLFKKCMSLVGIHF